MIFRFFFLAPPLPFGQMRSSTPWSFHLLTVCLAVCVPPAESWKSLSILMLGLWNFACSIPGHNHYDLGGNQIFLCLSVCYLAHFLTEIIQILGYLQIWIRYLSKIFWSHSWDICTLVPNNSEFFACLSVCYLAHFLTEITQILRYLQFWIRYLSEIFWRHSWDVCTLVPNNSEFLVCLSVC